MSTPANLDSTPATSGETIRAMLWDMDGTLVDTEPYWMNAERELVADYGGTWSDELALQCVGQTLTASAELIRAQTPVTLAPELIVERMLARVAEQVNENVPWRPGALELLAEAARREIPCALVTMSWTLLARSVLKHTPEGSFTVVVTGDSVTHGKPHPEAYLRAVRELNLQPAQCVALEDSPPGAASAVAAGVPTVGIPHLVEIPPSAGMVLRPSAELTWEELEVAWREARAAQ